MIDEAGQTTGSQAVYPLSRFLGVRWSEGGGRSGLQFSVHFRKNKGALCQKYGKQTLFGGKKKYEMRELHTRHMIGPQT
jgi:hypothetical protein